MTMRYRALALLPLFGWAPAFADAWPVAELDTIEVYSTRTATQWRETPVSIGSVDASSLDGEPGLALDEALNRIPGVYAQNRYNLNQGLRVSIRGFGSRASFGVRGIRVLVDDIPLTNPDGQTDLDALDLALVERVEVLRGPASALYGNGAGGVLAVTTRDRPEGRLGRLDAVVGEHGERRLRGELGGQWGALGGLLSLAQRDVDGHRDNMVADSLIGSGRLDWQLGDGRLSAIVQTLDIDAQDPGGLNLAEVRANPRAAAPNALRFATAERIEQQRLGLRYAAGLGTDTDYRVRGWVGDRDFANSLPFANGGQSAFDRRLGGIGAQVDHRLKAMGGLHRISLGIDFETQTDTRSRFNNGDGGVRGDRTLLQDEKAENLGLFVSDQVALGDWVIAAGLRYDELELSVKDAFLDDGDDSGRRRFDQTSYNFAVGYQLDPQRLMFVRYGSGFESPANNELANPDGGGFNPALSPAESDNLEFGLKHEGARLRAELVFYTIRNEGELVRFERDDQPGRSFYRNAGASDRQGIELSAIWQVRDPFTLSLAYSANDYRYRQYQVDGNDFRGNTLPGAPRQQLFAEAAWQPLPGWTGRLQAVALDRVFADDANTVRVAGYVVANARLAWDGRFHGLQLAPWLAVNNLFDIDYIENLRVNAGFGRYYEPAAGRTVVAGIAWRF